MNMTRSQLNIRVDSKLLSAIQARAKSNGVPLIDWVTNALQLALAETALDATSAQSSEALEEVLARLTQIENYQHQCEKYFPSLERRFTELNQALKTLQLQIHRTI